MLILLCLKILPIISVKSDIKIYNLINIVIFISKIAQIAIFKNFKAKK